MDEEKLKKIEKEVKEIIDNFMEKLKDVDIDLKEKDFYLIKENRLREENLEEKKEKFVEEWKKSWDRFDKENYLIAEKAKWKK